MFCRKCGAELGINRSRPAAELPKPVVEERKRGVPMTVKLAICAGFAGLAVWGGMKMTAVPDQTVKPPEPVGIIAEPGSRPQSKPNAPPAQLWTQLGLSVSSVPADTAKLASLPPNSGAIASSVTLGLPADLAGVHQGDCLISIDLHPIIGDPTTFMSDYVSHKKPGQTLSLGISRSGRNTFANITLR